MHNFLEIGGVRIVWLQGQRLQFSKATLEPTGQAALLHVQSAVPGCYAQLQRSALFWRDPTPKSHSC